MVDDVVNHLDMPFLYAGERCNIVTLVFYQWRLSENDVAFSEGHKYWEELLERKGHRLFRFGACEYDLS